jgi:hypothetical protein
MYLHMFEKYFHLKFSKIVAKIIDFLLWFHFGIPISDMPNFQILNNNRNEFVIFMFLHFLLPSIFIQNIEYSKIVIKFTFNIV